MIMRRGGIYIERGLVFAAVFAPRGGCSCKRAPEAVPGPFKTLGGAGLGRVEGSALRSGAKTRARKRTGPARCTRCRVRPAPSACCVSPPGCSRFCSPRHDSTAATRFGDFTTRPVLLYLERDEWRRARRRELPSVVVCSYTQRPFQLYHAPNRRRAWRRWDAGRRTAVRQRKALVFESS